MIRASFTENQGMEKRKFRVFQNRIMTDGTPKYNTPGRGHFTIFINLGFRQKVFSKVGRSRRDRRRTCF